MKKSPPNSDLEKSLARKEASGHAPKPRKLRKSQNERRQESMAQIMDTAEALFAKEGYNGVTLNKLAEEAGVDASLMRYYFGDKEQLFEAVFRRRGPELNQLRLKTMMAYRQTAGEHLELEGVIDALIRPIFLLMSQDQGWRNYMAIVAYVNNSRGPLSTLWAETFHYVTREFIADLRRIYPHVDQAELYWSYLFLSGALTFSFSGTPRIDSLSEGLISISDYMAILERFPIALASAIRSICERPEANPTARPKKTLKEAGVHRRPRPDK